MSANVSSGFDAEQAQVGTMPLLSLDAYDHKPVTAEEKAAYCEKVQLLLISTKRILSERNVGLNDFAEFVAEV